VPEAVGADIADQIVKATNRVRRAHKLPPLKVNAKLTKAALGHARNMARKGRMTHVLNGQGPGDRIRQAGYQWSVYAENVAWGWKGVKRVMRGWMKSPPHRKNLLNRDVTEIGVGVAYRKGVPYYCQVFAKPR
jgi:uncharacterized protein YkwD